MGALAAVGVGIIVALVAVVVAAVVVPAVVRAVYFPRRTEPGVPSVAFFHPNCAAGGGGAPLARWPPPWPLTACAS